MRRAWPTGCCSPANAPAFRTAPPAPTCPPSPPPWTCSPHPPRRRPSAWRSWRRWPPGCPSVRLLPRGRGPPARRPPGRPAGTGGGADSSPRPRRGPRAGPRGARPPAAAHHYDITRSAAQLMDVYAATLPPAPRHRSRPVPVPVTREPLLMTENARAPRLTARAAPSPRGPSSRPAPYSAASSAARTALSRRPPTRPPATSSPYRPRIPTRRPRSASHRRTAGSPPARGARGRPGVGGRTGQTLRSSVQTATSPDAPMVAVSATS